MEFTFCDGATTPLHKNQLLWLHKQIYSEGGDIDTVLHKAHNIIDSVFTNYYDSLCELKQISEFRAARTERQAENRKRSCPYSFFRH